MDWQQHLRDTAAHLVWMASLPGKLALDHAKHREQELMRTGMYERLPEYIKEARRELAEKRSALPGPGQAGGPMGDPNPSA